MSSKEKTNTRYWKVVCEEDGNDNCKAHGRYSGSSPYQAANKALSEIIRNRKTKGLKTNGKINFSMIESTRGSKKKEHFYEGKRIKLKEPIKYSAGGQELVKHFKNQLKKITKAELAKKASKKEKTSKK